jgi:hypothetical protein
LEVNFVLMQGERYLPLASAALGQVQTHDPEEILVCLEHDTALALSTFAFVSELTWNCDLLKILVWPAVPYWNKPVVLVNRFCRSPTKRVLWKVMTIEILLCGSLRSGRGAVDS